MDVRLPSDLIHDLRDFHWLGLMMIDGRNAQVLQKLRQFSNKSMPLTQQNIREFMHSIFFVLSYNDRRDANILLLRLLNHLFSHDITILRFIDKQGESGENKYMTRGEFIQNLLYLSKECTDGDNNANHLTSDLDNPSRTTRKTNNNWDKRLPEYESFEKEGREIEKIKTAKIVKYNFLEIPDPLEFLLRLSKNMDKEMSPLALEILCSIIHYGIPNSTAKDKRLLLNTVTRFLQNLEVFISEIVKKIEGEENSNEDNYDSDLYTTESQEESLSLDQILLKSEEVHSYSYSSTEETSEEDQKSENHIEDKEKYRETKRAKKAENNSFDPWYVNYISSEPLCSPMLFHGNIDDGDRQMSIVGKQIDRSFIMNMITKSLYIMNDVLLSREFRERYLNEGNFDVLYTVSKLLFSYKNIVNGNPLCLSPKYIDILVQHLISLWVISCEDLGLKVLIQSKHEQLLFPLIPLLIQYYSPKSKGSGGLWTRTGKEIPKSVGKLLGLFLSNIAKRGDEDVQSTNKCDEKARSYILTIMSMAEHFEMAHSVDDSPRCINMNVCAEKIERLMRTVNPAPKSLRCMNAFFSLWKETISVGVKEILCGEKTTGITLSTWAWKELKSEKFWEKNTDKINPDVIGLMSTVIISVTDKLWGKLESLNSVNRKTRRSQSLELLERYIADNLVGCIMCVGMYAAHNYNGYVIISKNEKLMESVRRLASIDCSVFTSLTQIRNEAANSLCKVILKGRYSDG